MVTFVYTNIRMRSILLLLSSLFCVLLQANLWAQPDKMITNRDNYFWQFGVAWTTTDDDGKELNPAPFDQLHGLPFPSRLYVDRYIYNGWSAEAVLGAQTYKSDRMVNDSIGVNGFIGYFDAALKYSFYKQLGRGAIDPYLGAGLGVSLRSSDPKQSAPMLSPTLNLSAGCTFWMSKQLDYKPKVSINLALSTSLEVLLMHNIALESCTASKKLMGIKANFTNQSTNYRKDHLASKLRNLRTNLS